MPRVRDQSTHQSRLLGKRREAQSTHTANKGKWEKPQQANSTAQQVSEGEEDKSAQALCAYNPTSNGHTESAVKNIKHMIIKCKK